MSAAEQLARRTVWKRALAQAAAIEDHDRARELAASVITSAIGPGATQLDVAYLWAEVKAHKGMMTRDVFNGIVAEARREGADPVAAALGIVLAAEAAPPEHEIRVSSGAWRYAEGADAAAGEACSPCGACREAAHDRGVYARAQAEGSSWRLLAELPWCHARIVHRDGGGARRGTGAVLSATPGGPRTVVDSRKIRDGSWAAELGMPLPADRKVVEAVATAIDALVYDGSTPEREAVPTILPTGRLGVPSPECLPGGYLSLSDLGRAEALGRWAELARLVAELPEAAAVLAASAGAWVVRPLRVQPHWLELWGDPGQGKTTMLRVGAAVWGDPAPSGGVCLAWNSTARGLGGFLGALGMLPAFLDEAGMAKFTGAEWARLIFETVEGNQRLTGERFGNGSNRSPYWASVLFTSGNGRVTSGLAAGKYAGLSRRVISVPAPFTVSAEQAELIAEIVDGCYGHLGAEITARFTIDDARAKMAEAAELLPLPDTPVARTIARQLHAYLSGALMIDEVLGLGELMTIAVVRFAVAYLADNGGAPEHDADRVIAAIRDAMAREPSRWPTVAEYAESRRPREFAEGRPVSDVALPQHGVNQRVAGVLANDGSSWVGVFPATWHDEICAPADVDESAALTELAGRGVLRRTESDRAGGIWQALQRVAPKPASPVRLYKLALPPLDDDQADEDRAEAPELPEAEPANYISSRAHVSDVGDLPVTPVTLQVKADVEPVTPPVTSPVTPPVTPPVEAPPVPDLPSTRAAHAAYAAEAGVPLAEVGDCSRCGRPTRRYGVGGRPFCEACSPPPDVDQAAARPAEAELQTPPIEQRGESPGRGRGRAEARRVPFLVLDDGRAHGPEGLVVETAGTPSLDRYGRCGDVGRLAELGLRLGADRLWVPSAVRAALGLPAVLPLPEHARQGYPHQWVDAASPEQWDVWPNDPAGLGEWMRVYRVPKSGDGLAIAFPEYMPPVSDSAPAFGDLPPAELAHALTLLWQSSTYEGRGGRYGGAHYHRSPGAWFGRLVDVSMRRARKDAPEAAELPPPFMRERPRGMPPLILPGPYMAPAREIPAGSLLAELDVHAAYLSAATGTPIGYGKPRKLRPGEISKLPGVHLCRVQVEAACPEAALMPWFPPAKSARTAEVGAWLDTSAAAWLAELGVPLRVDESYVWDDARRPFDSLNKRLGDARDQLAADTSPAAQLAAAVIKAAYARYLGGWLGSDFGGGREAGDVHANRHGWLAIRVQAEVRKQRNTLPMIRAGVAVLGGDQADSLYVAAESAGQLAAAPGTGGRLAVRDGRGGFQIKAQAEVTAELAAQLADTRASAAARRLAVRAALGKQDRSE